MEALICHITIVTDTTIITPVVITTTITISTIITKDKEADNITGDTIIPTVTGISATIPADLITITTILIIIIITTETGLTITQITEA